MTIKGVLTLHVSFILRSWMTRILTISMSMSKLSGLEKRQYDSYPWGVSHRRASREA